MRYHAGCINPECLWVVETDDYEMRAVLVGSHRTRTGHTVTMSEDGAWVPEPPEEPDANRP